MFNNQNRIKDFRSKHVHIDAYLILTTSLIVYFAEYHIFAPLKKSK